MTEATPDPTPPDEDFLLPRRVRRKAYTFLAPFLPLLYAASAAAHDWRSWIPAGIGALCAAFGFSMASGNTRPPS